MTSPFYEDRKQKAFDAIRAELAALREELRTQTELLTRIVEKLEKARHD